MITETRSTDALLRCGMIAGPLFLVVSFLQAVTLHGFDLERHPFSLLSLGGFGWIQIANFVVAGALFVGCAIGLRQRMPPGRGATWGPLLYGLFGIALAGGGVFVSDAADGFPPGTPEGRPDSISWHGTLHGLAFAVGMASLFAAYLVFARRFAADGDRAWARYSVATAVAFLLLGGLGAGLGDWRLVALAITVGWCWGAAVPTRFMA